MSSNTSRGGRGRGCGIERGRGQSSGKVVSRGV
jgi:hypothetical protein